MAEIRYEDNYGGDDCIIELDTDQVESCIEAELETAKRGFMKDGLDYDYADFMDDEGHKYTEIWADNGCYVRWTRL